MVHSTSPLLVLPNTRRAIPSAVEAVELFRGATEFELSFHEGRAYVTLAPKTVCALVVLDVAALPVHVARSTQLLVLRSTHACDL